MPTSPQCATLVGPAGIHVSPTAASPVLRAESVRAWAGAAARVPDATAADVAPGAIENRDTTAMTAKPAAALTLIRHLR